MTCLRCQHGTAVKAGTTNAHTQRFRCNDCGARFTEPRHAGPLGAHTTGLDDAERVFTLLAEGMSVRAVSRVTGLHKTTILSLLVTIGAKCASLFDAKFQNLRPRFVQADEIWTFVQKKQKRMTPKDDPAERGDQYVWIALDSETKAVLSYYVGKRDDVSVYKFMGDFSRRVTGRFQLTTDGLKGYIPAVEEHFGSDVDFAQLVKNYAPARTDGPDWFRPSHRVVSAVPTPISGDPDFSRISTSHIERANLTLRMQMRRFTRLTNGFSKSIVNLRAAVAVFMTWYNFCRVHQTLRITPAMEAKLTDHVWTIRELLTADYAEQQAA
jgi:IS1 family transposase/transposase-like protein